MAFSFTIEKKLKKGLGRAGILKTSHGDILTPAFVPVATKATVKALTPEMLKGVGAQIVLANTYHLYLEPGEKLIRKAGGLGKFMNWDGPTMTDSGGFQAFSLGAAFGKKISKLGLGHAVSKLSHELPLAMVDEDGVTFKSVIDGSTHRFTPERAIEIQHALGADIIFAFDECTSPEAPKKYQIEAMERTHAWAVRSLMEHTRARGISQTSRGLTRSNQALFGIVQGGRFEDLRKKSARVIGGMDFDGFGIGGSFEKKDMGTAVQWVNQILPEEKPRHLLGIGAIEDLFLAVENGTDTFDCVLPTRLARNGTLYTHRGRINILNAKFRNDLSPIDRQCECSVCGNYSRAYLSHLYRAKEILGSVLGTIHNLYFIIHLVQNMRQAILEGDFLSFKKRFLTTYSSVFLVT